MEFFAYEKEFMYISGFLSSIIAYFFKKCIDAYWGNFVDKKRNTLSHKYEIRDNIISLRIVCYNIKRNIDHKILFGIEVSSFAEDRNKLIEIDLDIEKIRFENIHVVQCFKEVTRWLLISIKDIEDWDLCRIESKKDAYKISVLDSKKEIDVHLKTLDELIEKYYPAPR